MLDYKLQILEKVIVETEIAKFARLAWRDGERIKIKTFNSSAMPAITWGAFRSLIYWRS
jgi:hypothetical protein